MPFSVSVPFAIVRPPPAPPMTPLKVPFGPPWALVRVSVWPPSATEPVPFKVVMLAPAVVPEMSNVPLSVTPELDAPKELAMLPVPLRARVAPAPILVVPE